MDPSMFMCKTMAFTITAFCMSSVLTLTFINLDRYLTLAYPFWYPMFMDMKKTIGILSLLWIFAIIMLIPPTFSLGSTTIEYNTVIKTCLVDFINSPPAYGYIAFCLIMVIPTTIIVFSFVGIFRIARKQKVRIEANSEQSGGLSSRDAKIIKTLLIMTVGFYLMWTPHSIFTLMWMIINGHTLNPTVDYLTATLAVMNSVINSIIYIPTIKPYRQRLAKMFGCRTRVDGDNE